MERARFTGVVACLALTVTGCTAATPSASSPPSGTATGGPRTTPGSTAGESPSATVSPSVSPTSGIADDPPLAPGAWRVISVPGATSVSDAVALPGGGLLAVGASDWNGAVWTSPDGENWTPVTDVPPIGAEEAKGLGVVLPLSGGGFLAGGGKGVRYGEGYQSVVWVSDDGLAWRESAVVSGFQLDLLEGGPGFISVGARPGLSYLNGALAWTSADGSAWAETPAVPAPDRSAMIDLVRFGDRFIAVGATGDLGPTQGLTWSSADGATWELSPEDDALAGAGLSRVAVVNGELLAAGSIVVEANQGLRRPALWTSPKGASWTRAYEQSCCGEFVDLLVRPAGVLGVYRWYQPVTGSGSLVLVRGLPDGSWQMIGRPDVAADVVMTGIVQVGDRLVGLGYRQAGDATEGVILLPPGDLDA